MVFKERKGGGKVGGRKKGRTCGYVMWMRV